MNVLAHLSLQTIDAMRRARRHYRPSERMSTAEWATRYRRLAGGAKPGPYEFDGQPSIRGILDAYDDPAVREIFTQKASQFGYTQGVELNIIGRHIHLSPCPILILFPKDPDVARFTREKLEPAIRATPELLERIPLDKRGPSNTQDYKEFTDGYLQLVGTNSPSNVKSTDAPVVIVCEPDDASIAVGGAERSQGDAITLGRERVKTFPNGKLVVGGTATVSGFSEVEAGMEKSDKRRYFVECPHCGHAQHLRWEQVRWESDAPVSHPVFSTHRPETARYHCEACDDAWSNAKKNSLIRIAAMREDRGWRATAPFFGIAGFYVNEFMSVIEGSRLELLVQKFLEAQHAMKLGKDGKMRSFVNNQKGMAWQLKGDAPEVEVLRERAKDYAEWTCPAGGLIVTGFVDVQRGGEHDQPRLELLLRAWGRELESWLVYFGIVLGNPLEPATWDALDKILATPIRRAGGGRLGITALGIDSGDGMTSDAVYRYVRRRRQLGVMATKGASSYHKEIFTPPTGSIDVNATDRASKYGLKLYFMGTEKAKDDIAGRLKLFGDGPRRMHWYGDVRRDYFEQLTSEVKMPGRHGRPVWTKKAGVRNEALDCEVGALHAAMKLRLSSYTDADWRAIEARVTQPDLLRSQAENERAVKAGDSSRPIAQVPRAPDDSGFAKPGWSL